jgi:hypothetical protein
MKENSHNIEDIKHSQTVEFKSKYEIVFIILFLIGMITSFIDVVEGPYESLINSKLYYKGYEIGLFPPLFLLISVGLFSSKKPLNGLLVHLFFLITVFSELFYNYGGLILRSSNHIILIPFLLYMTSVIGIFIFLVLGTIEINKWNKNL